MGRWIKGWYLSVLLLGCFNASTSEQVQEGLEEVARYNCYGEMSLRAERELQEQCGTTPPTQCPAALFVLSQLDQNLRKCDGD